MLTSWSSTAIEAKAKLDAVDRSNGIIEFALDGRILTANENFLRTMGYTLDEIRGQHHSLFVSTDEKQSAAYAQFWSDLRAGHHRSAEYRRLGKGGREIWIEASYNPILDRGGRPYKVIKLATDVTRRKMEDADRKGQIEAIGKSQAVIAFDLDGIILDANANFLAALGYSLPDIVGRHHRIFVDPATRTSAAYAEFWSALRRGEYQAGQFRRIARDGREIWIEASYNPILDAGGRPYKVVKFSTDITTQITLLTDLKRVLERNFSDIDDALAISNDASSAATGAAQATADNVQTMAAAAEELAASVAEISHSMAKSQDATDEAGIQVAAADRFTLQLSNAATAMGGIVGLIRTIAGQINLLALNATIESARAGEAGRGFAVVAAEVKQLADQAARATERIAGEIESVQTVSNQVVVALGAIGTSVGTMRDHVVSIATAVEEQSVVTRDISANLQMAASAVGMIAGNMRGISGSVLSVTEAVGTTKNAVRVLAR